MRFIKKSILMVAGLCLSGCSSYWLDSSFDAELDELVSRKHLANLGDAGAVDGGLAVADGEGLRGEKLYDLAPRSANPGGEDLPITADVDLITDKVLRNIFPQFIHFEDGAKAFGLSECLSYAVGHSPMYRSEKESLYIAAIGLLSERHLWGPRFFNTVNATINGTPEAGDHAQVLSIVDELGVTQKLSNGGTVSVKGLVNFVENLRDSASRGTDRQSAEVVFSSTLPLLRGRGAIATESLIQAERDLIYATRSFERYRRQFFVDVASDYFNLLFQQKRISNSKAQVKSLNNLLKKNQMLAKMGRIRQFEVQRNEQELFNSQIRLLRSEESYVTQLEAFKILIGMPESLQIKIVATELEIPEPLLENDQAILAAHRFRLDLQTRRDRLDDARRRVLNAKNQILPDLTATASATVPTDGRRDRGGLNLDAGDGRYAVGLKFDMALDRYVEKASYRRSLIGLEKSRRDFELEKSRIGNRVRSNIREIRLARLSLELQKKSVFLAKRRLEEVNINRGGKVQERERIEAAQSLLEAKDSRDESVKNLRVKILEYLLVTGQLRVNAKGQWIVPRRLKVVKQLSK